MTQIHISNFNKLLNFTLLLVAIWTLIIVGLLFRDLSLLNHATENLAKREALAHFQKDEAFRFWSATHGGFYVVTNERTPPNPYLEHVPERDIETPSGVKLTLMNPAYALRQMFEEYKETYGVSGHITSLLPLRPENTPDDWERSALESFENGETELSELTNLNGEPHLRFMKPLITQEGCLKCHEHQGYKVGDVRGGVSVSVPLSAYYAEEDSTTVTHIISFAALWLLGLIGLIISYRINKKSRKEKENADRLLQESHNKLETRIIERTNELKIEIEKQRIVEKKLIESQELYKGIINSTASAIAVYKPTDNGKDFIFLDFNPMAEKVDKVTRENVIGKKVSEVFPGVEQFGLLNVFQDVASSGISQHFPVSFYNDNRTKGYRDNYVFKLSSGEIIAIYQDVTERESAKKEITKLSKAIEQSPSVITITNLKGDIEYVNPKFTELTGYTLDEAKGSNPRILKSGKQPPEVYKELWDVITSGETWRGELHNKKKITNYSGKQL